MGSKLATRQNKKIEFFDIEWDTDGQQVPLPLAVKMNLPANFDCELEGADWLSDIYGWCIHSFRYREISGRRLQRAAKLKDAAA